MRIILLALLALSTFLAGIFHSCKKETSCEGCKENNKPPISIAGPDQVITLPTDSISLDGSASNDPDGTISVWLWTKMYTGIHTCHVCDVAGTQGRRSQRIF